MSTPKKAITDSLRAALQEPGNSVSHKNGKWSVRDRKEAWIAAGPRVFDDHVERLRAAAVEVLTERDPALDLETDERFAARARGKEMKHSAVMREGLAESLALLGSFPGALPNVTFGKAESMAHLAVRDILGDAPWDIWASLNGQLPMLAEAAPEEFMTSVEKALQKNPSPFTAVFAEEAGGALGRQYMSGLLWALETLAWSEEHLARVIVILGGLAAIDPGGQWSNRPINSLTEILLPWLPQTCAGQEKRIASVKALLKNHPDVGWKLLLQLLPEAHQTSSETRKPTWRPYIPADWKRGVTNGEYWAQTEAYANLALEVSANNFPRQLALVKRIPEFPIEAGKKLFARLLQAKSNLTDEQREELWSLLLKTSSRHKRYAKQEWAMPSERVAEIDKIADELKPSSPVLLSKRLFSRNSDLYDDIEDIEAQEKKVADRRTQAVEDIYSAGGLADLLTLTSEVDVPYDVGWSIGRSKKIPAESEWLPALLGDENSPITNMARGFVWGRFFHGGNWKWVDALKTKAWTNLQLAQFFAMLPFGEETWNRAMAVLPNKGKLFWQRTDANPYRARTNLADAAGHLLDNGRPVDALRALHFQIRQKEAIDEKLALRALRDLLNHQDQLVRSHDTHEVLDVIRALQESSTADPEELAGIEWSYLPLLGDIRGSSPKTLSKNLATDPKFFSHVVQQIYRSTTDEKKAEEASEAKKRVAEVGYKLLHNWKRPPGTNDDGTFDAAVLKSWLADVRNICGKSGHLEVAELHLGHVLKYAPADPSGLWIHKGAAEVLNDPKVTEMRSGYRCEWFNDRSAHFDSRGAEELKLAGFFKKLASDLEAEGFIQLAATLRNLAKGYEHDAARDAAGDWMSEV